MNRNLKGTLILLLAAFIWGMAFVAQNMAADVPPFLVNCLRSLISTVFLYGFYRLMNRQTKAPLFPKEPAKRKTVLVGSLICGLWLSVAVNFQQFGIAFYPEGAAVEAHAGFITALYVVLVPLFALFIGKKIPLAVWLAVAVSLVGFYLLCLSGGIGSVYLGDFLVLACAAAFALQILAVDRFVGAVGGVRLSLLQFLVTGIVSGILSLIFERDAIVWQQVLKAVWPILYLGIISSGIGYTLQIIGQKYAEPAIASLTMSLESVFAAICGWLFAVIFHPETPAGLSLPEIIGCILVFAAIVLAQLPELLKAHKKGSRDF